MEVSRLLDSNNVDNALTLCLAGVAAFPDYATGYLLLARVYQFAGDSPAATIAAERGLMLSPGSPALKEISRPRPVEPEADRELSNLASTLEHARMPQLDTTQPVPQTSIPTRADILITPTMASIYEKQGLFVEAIAAYRTLAAEEGGKKYEGKIAALEAQRKTQLGLK